MYNHKESFEDYLEKIIMAKEIYPLLRAVDLAKYIGFSKPSVSVALKKLKEQGYINIDSKTGEIILTDVGYQIGNKTLEKHQLLTDLLTSLGVNKKTAELDACKIEHLLSEETFDRIKDFKNK